MYIISVPQDLEGGVVLIPHSHSFFMRIPHPTFFSYWEQSNLNPAPFFSEIPDPENTLPDPGASPQ